MVLRLRWSVVRADAWRGGERLMVTATRGESIVDSRWFAAAGAGPCDGTLGLVSGLECLRSLPGSGRAVALGSSMRLMNGAHCVFHCAALSGSMLADSGRQLGVALSEAAPLSMRRVCEIGEVSGVAVLPVPYAASGVARSGIPACVLVVDAALNSWPLTEPGWTAVTACAKLLAHLVADLADS